VATAAGARLGCAVIGWQMANIRCQKYWGRDILLWKPTNSSLQKDNNHAFQ
jgi:hypothetical protein